MNAHLIVMLTYQDKTVPDAIQRFEECRDLPVEFWGFKNVGLPQEKMTELLSCIKKAGKKAVLEVVTYTEDSCLEAAKFACDNGFDCLLGTCFYERVWQYLKDKPIAYFPFVGEVSGSPSVLKGTAKAMVREAGSIARQGVTGIDLLSYRYADGDPFSLSQGIIGQTPSRLVLAGSIDSEDRIREVNVLSPWAFTVGGGLYTRAFAPEGDYRTNLERVLALMEELTPVTAG